MEKIFLIRTAEMIPHVFNRIKQYICLIKDKLVTSFNESFISIQLCFQIFGILLQQFSIYSSSGITRPTGAFLVNIEYFQHILLHVVYVPLLAIEFNHKIMNIDDYMIYS